jgi:hypothetical protein
VTFAQAQIGIGHPQHVVTKVHPPSGIDRAHAPSTGGIDLLSIHDADGIDAFRWRRQRR